MRTVRTLAGAALVLLLVAAVAQAQPGGRRGPGGRGPGGGMGGGMGDGVMMLGNEEVQKELKLTDDQKTKLKELIDKVRSDMRSSFEELRSLEGEKREAKLAELRAKGADIRKQAEAVLTADQVSRLKGIRIQVMGNRALLDADVIKALNISDEQKTKIEAAMKEVRDAMEAEWKKAGEGARPDWQAMRTAMQKANESAKAKIDGILTAAQKEELEKLKGAKVEIRMGGPGGGRGGNRPAAPAREG